MKLVAKGDYYEIKEVDFSVELKSEEKIEL